MGYEQKAEGTLDVTDPNENLDPAYQEWLDSQESTLEELDKWMEEINKGVF